MSEAPNNQSGEDHAGQEPNSECSRQKNASIPKAQVEFLEKTGGVISAVLGLFGGILISKDHYFTAGVLLLTASLTAFLTAFYVWVRHSYLEKESLQYVPIFGSVSIISIATLAGGLSWLYSYSHPSDGTIHGWLSPGSQPAPFECPGKPKDHLGVYLGGMVATYSAFPVAPARLKVIRLGGEEVLTVVTTKDGASISARIGDEHGLIATLVENEFLINNESALIQHPSNHVLKVVDRRHGQEVLNVEYLNPEAIRIMGKFYSTNSGQILITNDALESKNLTMNFSQQLCFALKGDGLFIFGPP